MVSPSSWQSPPAERAGWTLDRHILEQQRHFPSATGKFTILFQQIALAGKVIASRVNQAGLAGILGVTGDVNVQGEKVQRLDIFAHNALVRSVEAGEAKLDAIVFDRVFFEDALVTKAPAWTWGWEELDFEQPRFLSKATAKWRRESLPHRLK